VERRRREEEEGEEVKGVCIGVEPEEEMEVLVEVKEEVEEEEEEGREEMAGDEADLEEEAVGLEEMEGAEFEFINTGASGSNPTPENREPGLPEENPEVPPEIGGPGLGMETGNFFGEARSKDEVAAATRASYRASPS
jgi:hypothetical protein